MSMIKNQNKKNVMQKILRRDWQLFVLILLPALYYAIFCYIPMGGIIMAFEDFRPLRGVFGSQWVGLKWFRQFFRSIYFFRLVRNTFLLNFLDLIFGFPLPIIFAIFLNEVALRKLRNVIQTISYMPYFISTVIIVGILSNMLSVNGGIINVWREKLGMEKLAFMSLPQYFRSLYVGSSIWQGFGFSSIVYLSAISGIEQDMYEAASIDGASRWKKIQYITFPSILPTITICLILRLGSMLSVGFEKVILMYNEATYETADVISTYVYRRGLIAGEYSFGAAVDLFNSLINFVFVGVSNYIVRHFSETSLW